MKFLESFWQRWQKRRANLRPEDDIWLRGVIWLSMLLPVWALARIAALWLPCFIALIGISLGHWYSYHYRQNPKPWLRRLMFVAIHLALCWLFFGLIVGARVPQAQFALLTQAITSFDLRYRRSLFNTLIHSLANMYIAASLSRSSEYLMYLLLFGLGVLVAFALAEAKTGRQQASLHPQLALGTARPAIGRLSLILVGLLVILTFVVFLFTPRFANRPLVPPFSLNLPLSGSVQSEIINPGLPVLQINGWSNESSDYFYGFDSDLDLSYRGGLDDSIVMYVRSPSKSYWRSNSYDFYTGQRWQQSDKTLQPIEARSQVYFALERPLGLAADLPNPIQGQQIVQTFTIMREQPNLIFAAYRPTEIFIAAQEMTLDAGDALRLPEPLKPNMTYSVVSYWQDFSPEDLRQASRQYPPQVSQVYLQLPNNILARVKKLAQDLTASFDNPYDKLRALNDHLLANYPYNLYPPPHPPGAEVVDTFLFIDQEGVCEQYVTAMIVMARSLGIPARLAAGYGSGQYNALTGYYEVRLNNAHSWVEAYFPGYGWIPFDPTPGWIPDPYPTPIQNWVFSRYGPGFANLNLPLGDLLRGGLQGVMIFLPFATLLILAILLSWGGWRYRYKLWAWLKAFFASRTQPYAAWSGRRRLILRCYYRAADMLQKNYGHRQASETLHEFAQRKRGPKAFLDLTEAAEQAIYDEDDPDAALVQRAEQAFTQIKKEQNH